MGPDPRMGRVADVALDCLATKGYAGTTLRDIAAAAGVAEEALRARFGDMDGLLTELVSPLTAAVGELVASAAAADLRRPPGLSQVIVAYLDVLVEHRVLAQVVLRDPAAASSEAVRRAQAAMRDLRAALAGGAGADLDQTIRAASAAGAVEAAALRLAEGDNASIRDVITTAALAILLS